MSDAPAPHDVTTHVATQNAPATQATAAPANAPNPKVEPRKAEPRTFNKVVEDTANDLGIENPVRNHEIHLGIAHSLVQRSEGDLGHAAKNATEANAQKYLDSLMEKSTGLLFAAKIQAKLVVDFCASHGLPVPKTIAAIDAIVAKRQ